VANEEKAWNARRRDPRINGAVIYVARERDKKSGLVAGGGAGVVWCRWAAVKRIFHWKGRGG
jgi:hypothetical protein